METKKQISVKLSELRPEIAGELLKNITFQDKQTVMGNEVVSLIPAFDHFDLKEGFGLCLDQSIRAQFFYYFGSGDFKIYERDGIYVSWFRIEDAFTLIFYIKEDDLVLWQSNTARGKNWKFSDGKLGLSVVNG